MTKTDAQLLEDARVLLAELVDSREFCLYVGLDGSYHNRIKQWFEALQERKLCK